MELNGFRNLRTDGIKRIEGGHRFLKDHRDFAAANAAHFFAARIKFGEINRRLLLAMQKEFPADDFAGRGLY